MDPTRLFKPKDADRLSPHFSSSSLPSSDSPFHRRSQTTEGGNGCTFQSLFRTVCINGECKEEAQRFRQCPNRPLEKAVVDPLTQEETWMPATDAEMQDDLLPSFPSTFTPPSLRALGGATDEFFHEILPEIERMQNNFQRDPLMRLMRNVFDLPLGGGYVPPVFRRQGEDTQQTAGHRRIPLQDGSSSPPSPPDEHGIFHRRPHPPHPHLMHPDNGSTDPALPQPADLEEPGDEEDVSLVGPIKSMGRSYHKWINRVQDIVKGKKGDDEETPTTTEGRR